MSNVIHRRRSSLRYLGVALIASVMSNVVLAADASLVASMQTLPASSLSPLG